MKYSEFSSKKDEVIDSVLNEIAKSKEDKTENKSRKRGESRLNKPIEDKGFTIDRRKKEKVVVTEQQPIIPIEEIELILEEEPKVNSFVTVESYSEEQFEPDEEESKIVEKQKRRGQ